MAQTTSSGATSDKEQRIETPGLLDATRLLAGLRASLAHHEVVEGRELTSLLAYLAAWQSLRLSRTYADLLHDPDSADACHFFLADIYAPQNFTQRDYDGTRIYNFMNRFLPEATLYPLALALEINAMTQRLDRSLASVMEKHLGIVDCFDMEQYQTAYRLCNNYDERVQQIDMIVETGKHLARLRHVPFVSTTLRLARRPALRLGWQRMQDFLERGFHAWKTLRQPDVFLDAISQREKAILNRIYGRPGGAPDDNPFLVRDGGPPEIVLPG